MASLIDLKGFPMVFAYTEAMLNNQIALHREDMFPSTISFSQAEEEWEEGQEDPDWTFEVREFASPRISFDVPKLTNGAKLDIKILDGGFTYLAVERRRVVEKTLDISAHTLSIVTPVKQRRHDDFTDANFQAESIYADLSQIESASIMFDDRREIKLASSIKAGLEGIIKRGLKAWTEEFEKKNGRLPMVFGGTRIPKVIDKQYRLRPTGCTYSVTQRRDRNGAYIDGALNMLLQIDGLEMSNSPAAGAFDVPLPRGNTSEGVLIISSYALSKKIIVPALSREYDNRYIFEARHSDNTSNGDFILSKEVTDNKDSGWGYDLKLTTKRIEGELIPGAYRLFIDIESTTPHWSGAIKSTQSSHVDLRFTLEDDELQVVKSDLVKGPIYHQEDCILRLVGDILTCGFDEILRCLHEWDTAGEIGTAVHRIGVDVKEAMNSIIIPGGQTGVFDYVDVQVKDEPNINGYANLFLYAKFE